MLTPCHLTAAVHLHAPSANPQRQEHPAMLIPWFRAVFLQLVQPRVHDDKPMWRLLSSQVWAKTHPILRGISMVTLHNDHTASCNNRQAVRATACQSLDGVRRGGGIPMHAVFSQRLDTP